jgi:hypothetical protein
MTREQIYNYMAPNIPKTWPSLILDGLIFSFQTYETVTGSNFTCQYACRLREVTSPLSQRLALKRQKSVNQLLVSRLYMNLVDRVPHK